MTHSRTAKLFRHGRSQAVRLPKEFRLPGTEARIRRLGRGVLLEPVSEGAQEIESIIAALGAYRAIPFMPEGREQPSMPSDEATALLGR